MSMVTLEKVIALCKRRGFVYPSCDVYGGLNGIYDFGPLGTQLKKTIKERWLHNITHFPESVLLFDGSLLAREEVWNASGHTKNFHDPMIDCLHCKKRYREDDVDRNAPCPSCGHTSWTDTREFNLMFKTDVGALSDHTSVAYLRPETAQSIFINFKNIMSSTRVTVPFGVAQIGKAFRNEITPKQFLFRMREFEQMELEFFCKPDTSDAYFELWAERRQEFYKDLGLTKENLRMRHHEAGEMAHYSRACIDVEYLFPFGWKEVEGIAHRGDYDLKQHAHHSGKSFDVFDEMKKQSYIPHVIECSVGVERLLLTLLFDSYYQDTVDGEERVVLKLAPSIAPVSVGVFPLTKKLSSNTLPLYNELKKEGIRAQFDESGSIGKRYRRHDEIGTPFCVTFDFESVEDNKVTIRHRDTLHQERVGIDYMIDYINKLLR